MSLAAIFRLWLPLAVSFELMMLEGPAFQGVIGRLANPPLNLAAWGLAMSMSLLIESPVIMFLGTSIALARDGQAFKVLWKFMMIVNTVCTAITAIVAFTPAYWLVSRTALGQPINIAVATRPALQIMLLWTAAIGWRRFYQGVLVRHGHTRMVSYGTAIRLVAAVGTAVGVGHWAGLPGVQVAAIAVMSAVITEAIATTLFAGPIIARHVMPLEHPGEEPLTLRAVNRYHMPLAATTLLSLLAQPLSAAALARLAHPEVTLAAWPVAYMVLIVVRGVAFAYQEITVSQARHEAAGAGLRRFALWLGAGCTLFLVLILVTPLLDLYLVRVINLPMHLRTATRTAIAISGALPLLTALGAWARGVLMAGGRTPEVYKAMVWSLATLAGTLALGVLLRAPGMVVAGSALSLSTLVETGYLVVRLRRSHSTA